MKSILLIISFFISFYSEATIVQLRFFDYNTEQRIQQVKITNRNGEEIPSTYNEEGNIVLPEIEYGTQITCFKAGYPSLEIKVNHKLMNLFLGAPTYFSPTHFQSNISYDELEQLKEYINAKKSKPQIANQFNIIGEVKLAVTINEPGNQFDIQFISGISHSFDSISKQLIIDYILQLYKEEKTLSNKQFIITVPFY